MIDKSSKVIIQTAARAAGVPVERIVAALAVMEGQTAERGQKEPSLLLTQADTAQMLNVSRWTVRKLAKSGQLRPRPILGAVRFARSDVLALAAGDQQGGGP